MNKKVFIICAELNNLRMIEAFKASIRTGGESKELVEGVYAFKADDIDMNSEKLLKMIKEKLPDASSVKLFIMKTSLDAAWFLSPNLNNWLQNNI